MVESRLSRSNDELSRAERFVPGGVTTFNRLFVDPARFPVYVTGGDGPHVWDIDGNRYIDYVLGKGPIILGHKHPAVQAAVKEQLDRGNMFGLTCPLQNDVAEALLRMFPEAERVRFHKSGSESTASAARMARAFTGRPWIASSGYHGWHDWCSPGQLGVPDGSAMLVPFGYDLDRLEDLLRERGDEVAAVFVEPQPALLEPSFYHELRRLADKAGCLLVFDEVKSGLRLTLGGVQHLVDVVPDLTTVSKALSNGFCLSAVLGRKHVLETSLRTHLSGTYDTETLSFAAAAATLAVLEGGGVLERIEETGQVIVRGLNRIFAELGIPAHAFGPGCMFRIAFMEDEREELFFAEMARAGVLFYPHDNQFVSAAHGPPEVEETLRAAELVLARGCEKLPPACRGEPVAHLAIHEFPNRKGFLRGVPGPTGRASSHDSPRTNT